MTMDRNIIYKKKEITVRLDSLNSRFSPFVIIKTSDYVGVLDLSVDHIVSTIYLYTTYINSKDCIF